MIDDLSVIEMANVREYTDRDPVLLTLTCGRVVVRAYNEGYNNYTEVDLFDLLNWVAEHKQNILELEG